MYLRLSAVICAYADGGLAEQLDKATTPSKRWSVSHMAMLIAFRVRKGGSGGAWGDLCAVVEM